MIDAKERLDILEHAEEIRLHFEESIRFQEELKGRVEKEGQLHDESNSVGKELLEAAERIFDRADAHAVAIQELSGLVDEIEAHFAREKQQYGALFQAIEAREEAAQRAYDRIEAEGRLTDALEAEFEQLRARLRFTMV